MLQGHGQLTGFVGADAQLTAKGARFLVELHGVADGLADDLPAFQDGHEGDEGSHRSLKRGVQARQRGLHLDRASLDRLRSRSHPFDDSCRVGDEFY